MAKEGGYIVTSPLDPELITEAESVEDAFVNADDAARALNLQRSETVFAELAASASAR